MPNEPTPGIQGKFGEQRSVVQINAPVQRPRPEEAFFKTVAENLKNVSYDHLAIGIPQKATNLPTEKTALEFMLLQEARAIYETSNTPTLIYTANMRNRDMANSKAMPIKKGDRLHGMPIEFLKNANMGILAPEFYGGGN